MAFSPEQVDTLIELHRKNATLEAELSQAQADNRHLQTANQYLLHHLASRPHASHLTHPTRVHDDPPSASSIYQVDHYFPRFDNTQLYRPKVDHLDKRAVIPSSEPKVQKGFGVATPDGQNLDSEDDEDASPHESGKLLNITENPHAPRYVPSTGTRGYYRTVMILGLDKKASLKELAWKVCGGLIVSMRILDTMSLLGYNSAMMEFFEENAALNFVQHCTRCPVVLANVQANVELLRSPATPVPPRTYHNIVDFSATRCLMVDRCPVHITLNHLLAKLTPHEHLGMHGIIEMYENDFGRVHIHFDSVDRASSARARINSYDTFKPARAEFKADPCAIPCGSLSLREAKPTLFTYFDDPPKTSFRPPFTPRASRDPSRGVRTIRHYNDWDAPRQSAQGRKLDYEEDTEKPPPTPLLRRAKPVDYSELCTSPIRKQVPNILESEGDVLGDHVETRTPSRSPARSASSLESGEIVESLRKTSLEDSKHAPPRLLSSFSTLNPFTPVTNRHLGPPAQAVEAPQAAQSPGDDNQLGSEETLLIPDALQRRTPPPSSDSASSSDSSSSTDSAESERARNRRHADQMLAAMQASASTTVLEYSAIAGRMTQPE